MTTVLLIRHGRSTGNTSGRLSGWSEGVELDERGQEQAQALAARLAGFPLAALVTSPLERCRQTAAAIAERFPGLAVRADDRLGEVRYGDWTGRPLKELAQEPLWTTVQQHPSAVVFPGGHGESLRATQFRAVEAIREHNARIAAEHGPHAAYAICSHGDVIKAVVADALGLHLDLFQRIVIDPCSLTAIRYTPQRPFLLRMNDTGGAVEALVPPKPAPEAAAADGEDGEDGKPAAGAACAAGADGMAPGEGAPGIAEGDAVVGGGAGAP